MIKNKRKLQPCFELTKIFYTDVSLKKTDYEFFANKKK